MRAPALIASLLLSAAAAGADHSFTGYARDLATGALLYVETHAVTGAGTAHEKRVVLYRCEESSAPFARKLLTYGSERTRPEFDFVDARSGFAEMLGRSGRSLLVSARPGAYEPMRTRALQRVERLVADAGFDEFVRASWDALARGAAIEVPFLVPSRLDSVSFRVRKTRDTQIDGAAATVFRLSPAGPLGWFLPDIEVSYRDSDRRLLRYRGLTNIRDAAGTLLAAQIDFPDAARDTLPPDLTALLALPLAACGS
jgi:hypothetical protein